jgi:hypothetical protein
MARKLFNEAITTVGVILSEYKKEHSSGELKRTGRHSQRLFAGIIITKFS